MKLTKITTQIIHLKIILHDKKTMPIQVLKKCYLFVLPDIYNNNSYSHIKFSNLRGKKNNLKTNARTC